jgi:hypothetical protein
MSSVRDRARNLQRAPFEAAIAFAAVVAFVVYVIDPHGVARSAVGHTAPTLLPFWEVLYALAGVTILASLWQTSLRFEVVGLLILSSALAINAVSIVNFNAAAGAASAATFAALGGACIGRLSFLLGALRKYKARG